MTEAKTRHVPNYKLRFILLILAALLCILISFAVGRFPVSLADVIMVFATEIFHLDIAWDYATWSTVINIRLPRILAAFFVGAALATAGAAYQGMFQNPLVSPDILGASSGAGFGAALAIFMDLGPIWITAFAFAGAVICVGAAYAVSRFTKGSATLSMVLAGILVSSLFTAMTSFLKTVADTEDQLPEITYWLMGSLAGADMGDVIFAGVLILAGIIPIFLLRWRMNVLTLGEDEAKSMGINPHRLRFIVVACATLITAAAVSISGIIGWIGLVIPHFCRMIFGCDYRRIIPSAVIMGGAFLLLVDDLARCMATVEVPIGILTAFVGAPIFAYLLMMGGRRA